MSEKQVCPKCKKAEYEQNGRIKLKSTGQLTETYQCGVCLHWGANIKQETIFQE